MSKTQPPAAEALRRYKERNGYEYGKGPTVKDYNHVAEALKEDKAAVTPGQTQVVRTALGKDYLSLVSKYRAEHGCSKSDAMMAVNATTEGQAARLCFVESANPERAGQLFEHDYSGRIPAGRRKQSAGLFGGNRGAGATKPAVPSLTRPCGLTKNTPARARHYIRKMNPHLEVKK